MLNPVIIFGAKNMAKVALEIFTLNEIVVYGFLEEDTALPYTDIEEIPILGNPEDQAYLKLIGHKCEAFIATDNIKQRKEWVKILTEKRKIQPINAIHPKSHIASSAQIGIGNLIQAQTFINVGVKIGNHCNIFAGVSIDTNTAIADFVQIGLGCNIGENVQIGKGVFIGTGATIVSGIKIADNANIGAGSVVVSEVKKGETFFGNPAQKIQ